MQPEVSEDLRDITVTEVAGGRPVLTASSGKLLGRNLPHTPRQCLISAHGAQEVVPRAQYQAGDADKNDYRIQGTIVSAGGQVIGQANLRLGYAGYFGLAEDPCYNFMWYQG
jgi:hypothetical protein